MKRWIIGASGVLLVVLATGCIDEFSLTEEEELGKALFHDLSLSSPPGMGCVTCHDPEVAFADPDVGLPVSRGVVPGRYGNRNDQPVAYAKFIPPLHYDEEEDVWVGGLFWDGRVNTLEEQAEGPPLNPLEMAGPHQGFVAKAVKNLHYAHELEEAYGKDALKDDEATFKNLTRAIAAYERSEEFNRFDSKYDLFLKGEVELTETELRGLALFVAPNKGNCAACHPHLATEDGTPPLFTDFTYDNLGVPRNPELPFYTLDTEMNPDGWDWVDRGLGKTLDDPALDGLFRVPTLRNVALTSPYMHNGYFKTLFQVVAFYNSRDVGHWDKPEILANVNTEEMGNLGLSNLEIEDLVAFMETLTDGYDIHSDQ